MANNASATNMRFSSPDIPRHGSLFDTIKELRAPKTQTDTGWIVVGTWIDFGDPGNSPGTDEMSPPFLNGWENIPGFQSGFRLNQLGDIEVSAAIRNGTLKQPAWVMPEDYRRPFVFRTLQALTGRGIAIIEVRPNGEVVVMEQMIIPDTTQFGGGV